MKNREI